MCDFVFSVICVFIYFAFERTRHILSSTDLMTEALVFKLVMK